MKEVLRITFRKNKKLQTLAREWQLKDLTG